MASTEVPAGLASEADLFALPEKPGAELIDGVIRNKPSPSWEHNVLTATRTETVKVEPFDAVELRVGTLFG